MILGLDMDNTITKAPEFFSVLSRTIKGKGGRVYVVSSRSNTHDVLKATKSELDTLGIHYNDVFLLPDGEADRLPCPYGDFLDDYQAYLWQKVRICIDHKVTVFFDDDDKVIELFRVYAPDIQVFHVL